VRILVTGGAGFIGSNFVRHILTSYPDYSVINFDKLTYAGNLENLSDCESSERYSFVRGDICDREVVGSLEFDAIINFAAESHVDRSILDAQPFLQTNVMGTVTLLEEAKRRDCTFLHVSTDEVYGSIGEGFFYEDSPLMPNSPYSASKASSDLLVRSYIETHNLKGMITRCSNNYGPFQFPEKLIPLVILNAVNMRPIPVYGDGMNVRDWIYVIDHCRAIDAVLHRGESGEVYNVGSKNELTNISIIEQILAKVAGKLNRDENELRSLIQYVDDRKGHDRRYAIDPKKMEESTGWKPETDFADGIASTIEWYISNQKWWERIISGDYMNYYNTQYGERLKS
jgi:dTDP-glucose 4,6-dehydratase